MMSITPSSTVVLLVLTTGISVVATYKVQPDLDRYVDKEKRDSVLDRTPQVSYSLASADDYPDYQLGVTYDEYPLIVPKKRTALLMNRLILALQKAMRNQDKSSEPLENIDELSFNDDKSYPVSPDDVRSVREVPAKNTLERSSMINELMVTDGHEIQWTYREEDTLSVNKENCGNATSTQYHVTDNLE